MQEDKILLLDIFNIVFKRRILILSFIMISTLVANGILLFMPKVYEGQAVLSIPSIEKPFVSMLETRKIVEMVLNEWREKSKVSKKDQGLVRKIDQILVKPIARSDTTVKMIVRARDNSQGIDQVFIHFLKQLNNNASVNRQWIIEKRKIDSLISSSMEDLEESLEMKENLLQIMPKSNLITASQLYQDIIININRINLRDIERKMALLKKYEFIFGPYVSKNEVRPKVALYSLIAGMVGLFIGFFVSFTLEVDVNKFRNPSLVEM